MKTHTAPHEPGEQTIVLYDGVCNLCSGTVRFIARRDPAGYFRFGSLQSDRGMKLLAQYGLGASALTTMVLIERGRAYTQSDAVLRIARRLHRGWPLLSLLRVVPRPLRDACYRLVAARRYRWFGVRPLCERPPDDLKARFLE